MRTNTTGNKARYIGCHYVLEWNTTFCYLEYEYRGRRYEIAENMNKGSEPRAWQHRREQNRIDQEIEAEQRAARDPKEPVRYEDTAWYAVDRFLDFVEGRTDDI